MSEYSPENDPDEVESTLPDGEVADEFPQDAEVPSVEPEEFEGDGDV